MAARHLKKEQTAAWDAAEDDGLLEPDRTSREWSAAPDACEVCLALDGTRVPYHQPWPNGLMEPHAHDGCRCSSLLVFGD
jgi:hypothetical protein